jgi:hypothetical protein
MIHFSMDVSVASPDSFVFQNLEEQPPALISSRGMSTSEVRRGPLLPNTTSPRNDGACACVGIIDFLQVKNSTAQFLIVATAIQLERVS